MGPDVALCLESDLYELDRVNQNIRLLVIHMGVH
jgi:hypothetical protein